MLIFELSEPGRTAAAQLPAAIEVPADLPDQFRRKTPIGLPEVSELQVVRHYTNLSAMERRIGRLLDDFAWGRMDEVFLGHAGR